VIGFSAALQAQDPSSGPATRDHPLPWERAFFCACLPSPVLAQFFRVFCEPPPVPSTKVLLTWPLACSILAREAMAYDAGRILRIRL
jgi:hypothetical protein